MTTPKFKTKAAHFLTEGRHILDLRMGIVSHITDERYTIISVNDETNTFRPMDSYDLESTYCRDVYKLGKTIALTEIDGIKGLKRHPLYLDFSLEAYISAPIFIQNTVWGTINFSSLAIRMHSFNEKEVYLVEYYATELSNILNQGGNP
ncbi:MAG: GAF domain-containing protein [Fibrobacterales bacterium]